ncbi:hypothetical protein K439DRAFT_1616592 [Ramaria rubella]|nr:hypothetical protein K439DRAFT_1616592 [Ramaria rubella]
MPQKSKSTQKCLQNFPRLLVSHKVFVEEVPDEEFTLETMPTMEEDDSDNEYDGDDRIISCFEEEGFVEYDEEDNEEAEAEIRDDATLLPFAQTLQKVHDVSVAIEWEKEAGRKRKKHYTQNSQRMKERWAFKQ